MAQIKTVWVERGGGSTPSFSIYPPATDGEGAQLLYLTNDAAAFDGFFTQGQGAAVAMLELCALVGMRRADGGLEALLPEGARREEALWALWREAESRFDAVPLWALELLQSVFENLGEIPLALLLRHFAAKVRAAGRNCGVWSNSFRVRNGYPEKRSLPRHEECEPLDVEALAAHLLPGGAFANKLVGYEPRPGQVAMLRGVAQAFNRRSHLVVEAGTGVGKSIAYLLPAAAWSQLNGVPVVISTNTRNLQSQLLDKDLPLVREIIDTGRAEGRAPLKTALLKGRTNYLCLRQLGVLIDFSMFEFERPELRHFADAVMWALRSDDGDLDAFAGAGHANPAFLGHLASSGEECSGRACRYYRRCFMQQARQRALDADIVVANHALVFAEARSGGAILPPCGQVIFDEAHNLEEVATRHLSVEISTVRLMVMLRRVSRGREGQRGGVIETLHRQLENGAVAGDAAARQSLESGVAAVRALIDRIRRSAGKFFDAGAALACCGEGAVRMRCIPDLDQVTAPQRPFDANTPVHRLKRQVFRNGAFVTPPDAHDEALLHHAKDALRQHLAEAATRMQDMAVMLRQCMDGELSMFADQALGLESCASRLREFVADLDFVTAATEPEYVFWAQPGGRRASRVSFVGAPLSIAATLNETLFKNKDSCVFCSATLRVGDSFRYINRRMGFDLVEPKRFMEIVAESPFDYLRQCAVFATEFMPDPAGDGTLSYVDILSSLMAELFTATEGRALGLFTSYDMMNRVAGLLEEPLRESGIRLLVHGKSGTRDQITRIFREGRRCALLGTHSFWEGVDVTGEALSCVVMARLPFAAVGDPVVEARCEQIQLAGGNAFRDFTLPQAVIRFRQGFGRLIRTEEDRGVVVVADPRIVSRAYGSTFIRSLPCPVVGKRSPDELLAGVRAFFCA